ncbi:MAG TPA: tetratricopeptide repeat protein, partial [Vicinamibacterales bacterium]|nr:tetratricopeptide repeat protein [Vicinamibacterales bacterium]
MKSTERHRLKENEFAHTVARTREMVEQRRKEVATIAIALIAVTVVVGGYFAWRASRDSKSEALLAGALAVAEAPVYTPPPPAPGSPPPVQPPGTFRTERERLEAALPKLQAAADAYPNSNAGITARYHLAAALAELGRFAEAEQRYNEVLQKAGSRSIYRQTARLGIGEAQLAQGKGDAAMTTFKELSTDTNSQLPVDGVLMQLGRAAIAAGKTDEATRAFTRVVDEFPQSLYVSEARE